MTTPNRPTGRTPADTDRSAARGEPASATDGGPDASDRRTTDGGRAPSAAGRGRSRGRWQAGDDPATASAPETPDETDGPTRASAAVVLFGTLAAAALLVTRVGPRLSLGLAIGDALLFAASLWLVERDRYRVLGFAIAGVLALFVGVGFVVATGYASLQLLAALFPVTEPAMVQSRGLRVASATVVVFGGTVALVGAFSTVGNVLRAETVWDHARLAVKTFVVPLLVATLMLASTVLDRVEEEGAAPVLAPLFDGLDAGTAALLSPAPGRAHLFTFCALLFATTFALRAAVDALPVAELATDRSAGDPAATAETLRRVADRTAIVTGALLPLSLAEVALSPDELEGLLTSPVYGLLEAVTGAGVLRAVLAVTLVASLAALAVSWTLRRLSQTDTRDVAVELMPFVGGAGVVVLVALTHGTALDVAIEFVADRLPGSFATDFTRQSTQVVDFYGSLTVTLTVAALLVGLTAVLSLTLSVVTAVGMLPRDVAAPALAAGGVFVAAAFAAGAGVGAPVVLAGLVASFVVWDAGEYGTTLRRETGRNDRQNGPETAHLGASLAVGAGGALVALLVYEFAPEPSTSAETLPFALVAVVAGLFLLVAALR